MSPATLPDFASEKTRSSRKGLASYAFCPFDTPQRCKFVNPPEVTEPSVPGPFESCSVYRCQHCGHGVSRPALSDVSILYEGRESQDYQGKDGALATLIKKTVFGRQTRKLIRQAHFRGGMIADYGCGSGVFTNAIAEAAPDGSSVYALDFFDDPPNLLENVAYIPFEQLLDLEESADLVTCFHAVEHDDNPQAFIANLIRLMRPGGTLVIEVPNANCGWRNLFGRYWDNWYLPYHRVHFTRASLRALVKNAGLIVQSEHDNHVPVMGRSVARILRRPNSLMFVGLSAVLQPIQWLGEMISQEPSALRIIATKPE